MKEEAQNLGQLRQKSIADFFLAGGCRKVPAFEFNVFKSSSTRQTSLPLLSQQQQLLKHDDIDDPDGISSYPSSDINTNDKNVNHNIPSAIIDTNVIENFTDSESSFHRNLYSRIGTYRVYDVVRHSNNKKYGSSRCPLHLFRSLSLSHPQLRSPELSSWLCAKHLSPSGLKLEEQFAHLGARVGISAIRFENQENNNNGSVLFVVGGSNGCIRVYDHEECVGRIQRSFQSSSNSSRVSDPIYPVATVSTRRDIADIQWSVLKTDEIAVAYKFHPIVTIYDLNHPAEPKIILKTLRECHHGNNVIRYLPKDWCMDRHTQTASASTSSLHDKSIQVAPNPVKPLPRSKPTQKILAGSSNGWIRQWTYPSVNNRTSCEWEIRADPSSSRDFPVVDIQLLVATPGAILIANQVGIITLYDLFDLKTATFQSSASPKCLRRLNIWSSIPETIILPLVTGIAIVGSLQYPQLLHVSTSNNHMYLYDLFSESIDIDKFDYAASLSRKRNVSAVIIFYNLLFIATILLYTYGIAFLNTSIIYLFHINIYYKL